MKYLLQKIFKIYDISKLQPDIKKITLIGIKFSFIALLISTLLMQMYIDYKPSNTFFEICSYLIQSSSTFVVIFLIFGISFNKIKKQDQ